MERRTEHTVTLKISHEGRTETIRVAENSILLQALRENGYDIYSPCGGNGTCGKCKVWLKGEGSVNACACIVTEPGEILLPDRREARILVEQHEHTISVPFLPGPAVNLASYPHGVALDLGTTTLAFYLVNLVTGALAETRAVVNPQSRFGADVITRINYTAENKGGLRELQSIILASINEQLDHFQKRAGIRAEDLVKISVAGNTTMLHLLLGINPISLALAPFTPAFTDARVLAGRDLGLHCHPDGEVKLLPSVSAYIGADIVAGLASLRPGRKGEHSLFMDIGTNGELVLLTPGELLCCSAAAGPAFEGARISCGMAGTEGAISAYGPEGFTVLGDVRPAGICGSGLIDILAHLLDRGILSRDGLLSGDYVVVPGEETESGRPISVTRQDIREVQLAKAAVAAGIRVLLDEAGLEFEAIDRVYLAGGFGNYIRPGNAMKIGLIPSQLAGKIVPLGNTSGTGAVLALKSTRFNEVIAGVLARTRYIELSGHEGFTEAFALNMDF